MKTFQEFIFEKYYEPDEKLPSGETPVEKATQKSRKRARTIGSQSPENQDRWAKQYDLTRTKVKHGADNPSLNTKVGHREKDEIEIDHDDKYMFLKHKPSGVSFDVEKSDESQYDDVRTIQWNHSQDKVKLSPKEKFKLARTAQKVWDTHVSPRLPNKSIVHNTPSSSYDNRGQPKPINRRSEIYKKAGFGSVDSDGDQFAEVGRPKSPKQIAKGKTRLKPLDPRRAKVEVEWGKEPDEYEEWEDQVNLSNFLYIKEGKTFSQFIAEAKETKLKMLRVYHGTSKANAEKIKSDGFKDTEDGVYGSGVYSSTSRNVARRYSRDAGAVSGKHAVDSGVVSSLIPSKKVKTIRQSNPESQEGRNKSKELRKSGQPAVRIKNAATGHETAKPDKGYEDEADYVVVNPKTANKGIEKRTKVFRPTKDQKVTNRYGSPGREDGGYYTDRMKPRIEKPYVDRRKGTKKTQPKRK